MRGETHISTRPQNRDCAGGVFLTLAWVLSALVAASAPAAAADPKPRAIIIFDGSGSMWGRLGGPTKFEIARREIAAILPSYDTQIAMGLIVYGHRRKSDCNDIQILAAPRTGQARDLVNSINSISPRGKTPIASSLESAATLLADDDTGHIIVLTDGVENCRKDLCETVSAIREASPGLTINAIGLGLRTRDIARIQCVSERGGGRLVVARDADTLRAGLLDILDDIASGVSFAPDSQEKPKAPAISPKVVLGPPRLQLRALQAASGPLIDAPVTWRVTSLGNGPSQPLFARAAAGPDVIVPLGRYRIEARLGSATASREITVTGRGDRSVHLTLDVARLDIPIPAPLARGETITVIQTAATGERTVPPKLITKTSGTGEQLYLPPGDYVVRRDNNATSETHNIALQAGDTEVISFDLALATIRVMARLAPGNTEPILDVIYTVERRTGAGADTWTEIARSAAPAPTFTVPEGTFRVSAHTSMTRFGVTVTAKTVTLQPGNTAKIELNLQAGTVHLNAIDLSGTGLPKPVRYRLTRIRSGDSTPPANLIVTARTNPVLTVPAGHYRIDAHAGQTNLKATTEVIVSAGAVERVGLTFNPARIELSVATPQTVPALRAVAWDVRKATAGSTGASVWSGEARAPKITLAPGRYVAIVTRDGRERRQEITLIGGQTRTVVLPAP